MKLLTIYDFNIRFAQKKFFTYNFKINFCSNRRFYFIYELLWINDRIYRLDDEIKINKDQN